MPCQNCKKTDPEKPATPVKFRQAKNYAVNSEPNEVPGEAYLQMRNLYQEFKALHPNSKEQFEPTAENLQRWHWHIVEAGKRPAGEAVDMSIPEQALSIAKGRSFATFYDMPPYMRERYLHIAGLFPGIQFYACGSRVKGEYIEKWSGESIRHLRKMLHKPEKEESDYDVCIDQYLYRLNDGSDVVIPNKEEIRAGLPKWADLITGVPKDEKIAIPMWSFDRLPQSEHARVIELFEAKNWGELMVIHNQYFLSANVYCCDVAPIRRHFGWAIEQGIIKA